MFHARRGSDTKWRMQSAFSLAIFIPFDTGSGIKWLTVVNVHVVV